MQTNLKRALSNLDEIVESAIQNRVFPGAVIWIHWQGETIKYSAYGRTAYKRYSTYSPLPVTTQTLYDLASLTKVVATTWAIIDLKERGMLKFADRVSQYIPSFGLDQQKATTTIWQLLTHTTGLPGFLPLYKQYQGKDQIVEAICRQSLLFPPGSRRLYCDAGFILLGEIVHVISSMQLDAYTQRFLFSSLDMKETMFNPPESLWSRIAPTEYVRWRGGLVHGRIHDENAWVMDGIAGHAGLFATIGDIAKFCIMILGLGEYAGNRILGVKSIIEMTSNQSPAPDESYGLGWMINSPFFMGRLANNETFGHTGFTGTSMILSPRRHLAIVLLSNRVCPRRHGPDIGPYRRKVADVLAEFCGG